MKWSGDEDWKKREAVVQTKADPTFQAESAEPEPSGEGTAIRKVLKGSNARQNFSDGMPDEGLTAFTGLSERDGKSRKVDPVPENSSKPRG